MTRVPSLSSEFRETAEQQTVGELLTMLAATDVNMFRALANAPNIHRGFCLMAIHSSFGDFPRRTREAVILRVAALVGSDYEWSGHAAPARAAGLSDEAIVSLRDGNFVGLDEAELAAVRYAEAVEQGTVDDDVWADVASHFDDRHMVELTGLVAFYGLAARMMNALDVDVDNRFRDAVTAGTELRPTEPRR